MALTINANDHRIVGLDGEPLTVTVTEHGMFHAELEGELFSGESIAELEKRIKTNIQARNRVGRQRVSLDVYDDTGRNQTVTGIHATQGRLLGVPDHYYGGYYVAVPWINAALAEIRAAQQTIATIREALKPYLVTKAETVQILVHRYEEAKARAETVGSLDVALATREVN